MTGGPKADMPGAEEGVPGAEALETAGDAPGTAAGTPGPDRRAVRHTRTRNEILDAAAELVTEQGVEALNLSELATRAGFSNAASLYRYFSSKKELMAALMRRGLELLEDHLQGVPADLPPEEQVVEFCLAYVDYARTHPGERALLLTTTAVVAPEDRAATLPQAFVERVFGLIAAVMAGAGGAGSAAAAGAAAPDWTALSTGVGSLYRQLATVGKGRGAAQAAGETPGGGQAVGPDVGDVFAMLHAVWALAQGMAEYDRLYTGPEREVLRARHREVFRAYVEGSKLVWTRPPDEG
jgi:AcrR family transcriptional regulator